MATTHLCKTCETTKPISDFRSGYKKVNGVSTKSGHRDKCKACEKISMIESKAKKDPSQIKMPEACNKCHRPNTEVEFSWRDKTHTLYRLTCKSCINSRNEDIVTMKICENCKENKSALQDFDKYRKTCNSCHYKSKQTKAKNAIKEIIVPEKKKCIECDMEYEDVDENFSRRSDTVTQTWRGVCKKCVNLKAYYVEYRERKREEDEEGFLAHNAEIMRKYVHEHPEITFKNMIRRNTETIAKIGMIKTSAKQRGFEITDLEILEMKLVQPCHYCGHVVIKGERLNGLDRVNAEFGYNDANTVSCCETCNQMKGCLTVDMFLHKIRKIYTYSLLMNNNDCVDKTTKRIYYNKGKPNKQNELSKTDKQKLWGSSCYLCGIAPSFGIDRFDAGGDYTIENSMPCCTECNYMKKDAEIDNLFYMIKRIYDHTNTWVLPYIDDESIIINNGNIRHPIKVTFQNITVIFPSNNIIDMILPLHIQRKCTMCDLVTNAEFRNQNDPNIFNDLLKALKI